MERTCPNEHEFKWSRVIIGAEVCTHCGLLRVASEIDHDYFDDLDDWDYLDEESSFDD